MFLKKHFISFFLLVLGCFLICPALSDTLELPADLKRIESQAFSDITTDVIVFPDTVEYIADDAFSGSSFIALGNTGSYAEQWCNLHSIPFYTNQSSDILYLAMTDPNFSFSGITGEEDNPQDRMAHNIYSDPDLSATSRRFSAFSIDFCAEYAPKYSYWALCNWSMDVSSLSNQYTVLDSGGAYAGLQITDDGPVGIMSFWEIRYKNRNGLETTLNAKRLFPSGEESYFGGEGDGTNYIGPYNWKPGRWYRMLLRCSDNSAGNTIVEQWVMDLSANTWTLLSRFDTGLQHSCFIGDMSQFMENYSGSTATEFRSFRYKNLWVKEYGTNSWKALTRSTLSVDTWWDNKKGYYAFGCDGSSLWGVTCGYGTDIVKTNPDQITSGSFAIPGGNQPSEP